MKNIILTLVAISGSLILSAQDPGNLHRTSSPIDYGAAIIKGGFWAERMETNREISIPYLLDLAKSPEKSAVVRNFEIAAGLKAGEKKGTNWQDAWLYKIIEAASYSLADQPDAALEAELDSLIEIIAKAQTEDGYIATQTQIRNWERFEAAPVHEFYTMGHLLTAGAVHYKITGKTALLDVADKCATYLYNTVKGKEAQFSEFPYNPSIIMGAVDLYRVTGKAEHLALAEFIVDLRGYKYAEDQGRPYWAKEMLKEASDQNQNFKPLRIEDEVLGHAVFFTYLYAGATDVFMETGDTSLLSALDRLWNDLTEKKMYVTGGVSPEHKAMATRKTGDHRRDIVMGDPVHEGISGPYDLPNHTAYNETCGQVGNFMWNWRMLLASGEAKYGDIMELSIYNSILSGVELDGTGWFYTNPLAWDGQDHVLLNHDSHKRFDPGMDKICCPTNLSRTLAAYENFLYSVSEHTLWVHHFAENNLTTTIPGTGDIELAQRTQYPWNGTVALEILKIRKKTPLTIKIRIPEWAKGANIMVNGELMMGTKPGSYAEIEGVFRKGDLIKLELPMDVRLMKANSSFHNLSNQVAVKRGPVVYCLESLDIENGAGIDNIYLPVNAEWNINSQVDGLQDIPTLECLARELKNQANDSSAYAPLESPQFAPVRIRLIPYFAWNNREEPKMRVWLPVIY